MNAKVISFINLKGGVGKTTICLTVGEILAFAMNRKVLKIIKKIGDGFKFLKIQRYNYLLKNKRRREKGKVLFYKNFPRITLNYTLRVLKEKKFDDNAPVIYF